MPKLDELFVATRTRNVEDAETDDDPNLVIRAGANILFTERLSRTSSRLARGAAGVWRFDVRDIGLDSAAFDIEIQAGGDDAWSPEHVIVWGTAGSDGTRTVIPLGAAFDLADPLTPPEKGTWISTDTSEGEPLLVVPRVDRGGDDTRAQRVIVIVVTSPYPGMFPGTPGPGGDLGNADTTSPITLQGGGAGRLFLSYTLPSTPQSDVEVGGGGFYVAHLAAPFSRNDLEGGGFTLTIGSDDWWVPEYFAVFGITTFEGGRRVLIPFVASPAQELRQMSSASEEGFHSFRLTTARVSQQFAVPVVGGMLTGERRT